MAGLTTTLARVTTIAIGGFLVVRGEQTVGTLVAFLGYIGGVFGPVQGLTGVYKTLRKASVSVEEICSILDARDHLGDAPHAQAVTTLSGRVELEHVSFGYRANERPMLETFTSPHSRAKKSQSWARVARARPH